ncbi:MAG: exonuclease domain-containing protein [Lachnospiraceae bacterium]|nr:exonuclease domain-containing protein [Lachnospiraceae bacterium]
MKHIVVDLEMNNVKDPEAKQICLMETIEIGAVMLDDNLNEISSFQTYVKPEYNDHIVRKIRNLTGISDEMVMEAPLFKEALKMFTSWCMEEGDDITIYAWSESDYEQISKEMILKHYGMSDNERLILENEWSDFQHEFDSNLGFERRASLNLALELGGIEFSGREHDALDDARNTAKLLHIFRDEKLYDKVFRRISEYMHPTSTGSTIGSLIDFSELAIA